ncbi:MAG: DUF3078 domain-containing protein [Bacteroidetes bacterium]|nr:DUF3078 domain-containing protein [Bacteroidota bacterium]
MKRSLYCLVLTVVLTATAAAQAPTDSVVKSAWTHSLAATLNLSQVSYTNWAQGGDNALAYVLLIAGKSVQDLPSTNWATTYNFAYGEARLNDFGLRKTDDKIDLATVFTYKLNVYVNPYASVTFLSQFTTGYKYQDSTKTAVSGLFDPAYSVQSVGFGYQPSEVIKTRLGFGVRETFTSKYNQYADDPNTTDIEKTKIEGGLESVTELAWPIDSTVLLTSKLQLFAPIKTLDKIVMHMDNALTAKVSKYISTSLIVQLINDPVVTPRTQVKEGLAIGINYVVF